MAKVIKAALIAAAVVALTIIVLGPAGLPVLFTEGALASLSVAMQYAVVTFTSTLIAGGIGMITSRGVEATGQNFGTKVTGRGAQVPRQIVYGKTRIGGTIVKMSTSGTKNNKLHLAIVLAGHEIESLEEIYFHDTKLTTTTSTISGETVYSVTNSKYVNTGNDNKLDANGTLIRYTFHDGSQTAVDGLANATISTRYPATAKFQGMAYVYMEIIYDPEKMPSLPPIWFVIKGKKVYDPRTDTTEWSDNPALIIRDYLTDTLYGLRAKSDEINDTTAGGGFQSAANTCDVEIDLDAGGSSTEKRYTLNGFINAAGRGDGVLEGFLSACAGKITYTNGKFNLFVSAAQTPSLTINDDDVLSSQQISTKTGSGELYNAIKSLYVDSSQNYQGAECPVYQDATYLSEDTPSGEQSANYVKILENQLPFTVTHTMAQRIQKIAIKRQREATTISLLTSLEFMQLQPSDWVYINNERLGYVNKTFEVVSMNLEFGQSEDNVFAATRLVLQEVSAGIYDFVYNEYSTPQTAGATPEGGDRSIDAPTVGSLVQRTRQEGPTAKIDIIASWTNSTDSAVQGTEIRYKESAESTYDVATVAAKGSTTAVIQNVQVGKTYDVQIRHFSWDNVYSSSASYSQIQIAEPDTLSVPTGLAATTDKPFFIELTWTNPSNTNLRAVEVHYSTTSGFTPSAETLLNTYYGDVGKKKKVILGVSQGLAYDTTYYFKLRAINIYGTTTAYTAQASGVFKKAQNADVENLNASAITAGTIDASVITVENINAANINAGSLDAAYIDVDGVITAGSLLTDSATIGNDIRIGSGESVFSADSNGIYLGNETFANAEFRVTPAGALTATGVTVSGAITATSGSIANSVTVGGTAASTVASNASAGNQVANQTSLLPRADDSEWAVGDYTGKMGIWVENGSDENEVVLAEGPHGDIVKVWRATSTDGINADGGFYNDFADAWPIEDDVVYRLSVFIKQDNTNGTCYFGAYNYSSGGSNINLYKYDGTGGDSNKYWASSDLPTQGDWYLLVGYINPSNTNISGGKGGIYKVSTGEKTSNFDDWRFSGAGSETDATKFTFRTYQYYADTTPTAIMEWAHPRVDRMDRRAPSIAELLRGWTDLATPIEQGVTITGGGITLSDGGAIKGGQSAFDTGTGFFLGYDSAYKFSIGNASGRKLTWDGSALEIDGNITARDLNIENATVTGTLSANNLAIDGVTLDTNASGQIIIADGGVSNNQLATESVALGNIIAGSVSKVNPVTQTQNIYRWAGYDDAGNVVNAVPSGITVEYDSTERALEIRNDGDVSVRSDTFVIDQNSIYKITFKVKKDSATGLWYVGAYQASSATTGQVFDSGNGQTEVNFTTYSASDRQSGTNANAYFDSGNATTSYVESVCYLIGANVNIDEVPSQSTLIIQAAGDSYKHVGLRILNWGNSGTTTSLFVKDLSVVEMTATTIIAENISATNLSAISSDLGSITAGSLNINDAFTVSSTGVMTATGATVSGAITATSLTLSGTSIAESQLATGVQTSLGLADSALQIGDIASIISAGNIPTGQLTFNNGGPRTITYSGNNITSSGGDDNSWNTHVYSSEHYASPCVLQFEAGFDTTYRIMMGLNEDPTTNTSYSSIDYAWYLNTSSATIYESGAQAAPDGGAFSYAVGDKFSIVYDGDNVYYYHNDTLKRTVSSVGAKDFYLDSSVYDSNTLTINDVRFAPISRVDYGSIGGVQITPERLYQGSGTFGNSNTGFYLDSRGRFSLQDKLKFDASATVPTLEVTGLVTADRVRVGTGTNAATMSGVVPSAGQTVARFYTGDEDGEQLFRVDSDGSVHARDIYLYDANDNLVFSSASGFAPLALTQVASGTTGVKVTTYSESFASDSDEVEITLEQTSNLTVKVIKNVSWFASGRGSTAIAAEANASAKIPDSFDLMIRYHTSSGFTSSQGTLATTASSGAGDYTRLIKNTDYQVDTEAGWYEPEIQEHFATASVRKSYLDVNGNSQIVIEATISNLASGTYFFKTFMRTVDSSYNTTQFKVTSTGSRTFEIVDNTSDGGFVVDGGASQTVGAADITSVSITANNGISGTNTVTTGAANFTLGLGDITPTSVTTTGDITVGGNLTVNGTTTTLNTATLQVEDKNITLNYGAGDTSSTADGAGITIQDAVNGSNDATFLWNATESQFRSSHLIGQFGSLPAGSGDHDTFHWNQILAAFSDNSGASTYIILDTSVPQDSYVMGGFTLICFNEYDDHSEGDVINIYGYWNPESNGGFTGFRYVCSNPDFEPTIQVGRNSSGNTAFLISGFDDTRYTMMVAKDLYAGYYSTSASASWGDGWAFSQASSTSGYSNLDTLVRIGITDTNVSNWNSAYDWGDHSAEGYITSASLSGYMPTTGGKFTGNIEIENTQPILVLDDSNATNDTNLVNYISFQRQGSERGWIGFGSASNDKFMISGSNGYIWLNSILQGANATFDNGTNTTVNIVADDDGMAQLRLYGDSQGTGRVFVGQSPSYGGGIEYNGDGSPSTTGSPSDSITLFRNEGGTFSWTAYNAHNDDHWVYKGDVRTRGQVRATGWWGSATSDQNGLAAELGVSSGRAHLISYNRSSSAYGDLTISAPTIDLTYGSSSITVKSGKMGIGLTDWDTTNLALHIGGNTALERGSGLYLGVTGTNYNSWQAKFWNSGSTTYLNAQAFQFDNTGYGSSVFFRSDANGFDVKTGSLLMNGTTAITSSGELYNSGSPIPKFTASSRYYLGNNDWTSLILWGTGSASDAAYSATNQGVQVTGGSKWFEIPCRIPIDPEAQYRVIVRVKQVSTSSGSGSFYCAVNTLNENFSTLSSDTATSYNYGVAVGNSLTAGTTYTFDGVFSGYNATNTGDLNKFDPEGKYFNVLFITNYQGDGVTCIQSVEIERVIANPVVEGLQKSSSDPILINSKQVASRALRVYYDMDVFNTISFTDSSWTEQGRIAAASNTMYYNGDSHVFRSTSGGAEIGSFTSTASYLFSEQSSNSFKVGRNSNENLEIYVDDNNINLIAVQDADNNNEHNFVLNRAFGGTGESRFAVRKDGSNQFQIDSAGNASLGTYNPISGGAGAKTLSLNGDNGNTYTGLLAFRRSNVTKLYIYEEDDYFKYQGQTAGIHRFLVSGTTTVAEISASEMIHRSASGGKIRAVSVSDSGNNASVGATWSTGGGYGMFMEYNPNSAVGYLQNSYNMTSGTTYGDIAVRQLSSGNWQTRLLFDNDQVKAVFQETLEVDSGLSSTFRVLCDNDGNATIEARGDGQGTGIIYVGQSSTYGGGIEYNGDGSPATTGAGSDYFALFRREEGTNSWTARNYYSNNNWEFREQIKAGGSISASNTTVIRAAHYAAAGSTTGAILIQLPGTRSGNWSMPIIKVSLYEYSSRAHNIYYISGHNWTSGWYNNGVIHTGPFRETVKLVGNSGTNKDGIIIGSTTESRSYIHVTVEIIAHPSFYQNNQNWQDGWTVGLITSESGWSGTGNIARTTMISGTGNNYYDITSSGRLYFGGSSYLDYNASHEIKFQNNYGYISMGPQNTSGAHIYTDRDRFYFNRRISLIDNTLVSYNDDLQLKRMDSDTYKVSITTSGLVSTQNVTAYSDERLKEDIKPIQGALETVKKLQGVSYTRKDSGNKDIGFIAQAIERDCPEIADRIVNTADDEMGTKHLNYQNMVALLTEAIKTQQQQIDALTQRIKELEDGNN